MIDDVYNSKILELAAEVPAYTPLANPDGKATRHSKLCGSKLVAEVAVENGVLSDLAMEVKACALGQAAASVVAANADGATLDELQSARADMQAMLKDGADGPSGRFSDLRYLAPVRDFRARHASTLLAIEAVTEAMEQAVSVRDAA